LLDLLGYSVEHWLTLPTDEAAMSILADLKRGSPDAVISGWNYQGGIQQAARNAGASNGEAKAAGGVALEAWEWLRAHGFIASHPEHLDASHERLTRVVLAAEPFDYIARSRSLGILRDAPLDDELRRTVEPLMAAGTYDDAVLAAMRLVEDRVRFAAGYPTTDLGVDLMRKAFGTSGKLRDKKINPGEQNGRMDLFAGAIGVFKNPSSHRIVRNERDEAIEAIFLANTLLRILGEAVVATRGRGSPRTR
jgi:uncharacterized protein (TIGR02391 family)